MRSKAMPATTITPEALLHRLEWTVMRRLDGLLHGDYRTLFRGHGVDLADLREYQHSDDVRHIDWNVTARLQTPYVRVYNEERETSAWFLLDLTSSLDFGSGAVKKRAVAAELVGVLARMLARHGNRVGAVLLQRPGRGGDTGRQRPPARAAHPAPDAGDGGAHAGQGRAALGDPAAGTAAVGRPCDRAALAAVRRVGLHQRARLGQAAGAAVAAARGAGGAAVRPAGAGAARPRLRHDAGCGERRAAVRRYQRPRLPQALRGAGRGARGSAARRIRACRRRRAGTVHRGPPDGCRDALRRPAQAPQQPDRGRRCCPDNRSIR